MPRILEDGSAVAPDVGRMGAALLKERGVYAAKRMDVGAAMDVRWK